MHLRRILVSFAISILSSLSALAKPIKIGVIAGPSVQVLAVAQKVAKEKYNLDLQPVIFTNYMMPNEALNTNDIYMNIFQTVSFLKQAVVKRGYNIVSIGNTYIYPMGVYSKKISSLSQLKNNSTVAIPNDSSNQGRALLLLSQAGLLKLKSSAGEFATVEDILSNPKHLKVTTLDSSQLPRVVSDVDAVVLNNDFVARAGFQPEQSLVHENPNTAQSYINILVVNSNEKDNKELKEVVKVMHSKEVVEKNLELFPGAIQAWHGS